MHTHNTHAYTQSIDMGAIVDPTQRKSIDEYVQQAKQDGAEVYQACACMPSQGCFYPPTLITKVEPVSICVQEEVGRSNYQQGEFRNVSVLIMRIITVLRARENKYWQRGSELTGKGSSMKRNY